MVPPVAKSDRDRRFRRLGPQTGDLFAHYGIQTQGPTPPTDPTTVDVVECPGCGWWRPAKLRESCWLCAAPAGAERR